MKTSKTVTYINRNLYGSELQDNFRRSINKFWHNQVVKNISDSVVKKSITSANRLKYSGANNISTEEPKYVFSDPVEVDTELWTEQKQTVQIYADDEIANDSEWQAFILGGSFEGNEYAAKVNQNITFLDLNHQVTLPLTRKENRSLNSPMPTQELSVVPEYNFYVRRYENPSFIDQVPEVNLPCLYSFASMLQDDTSVASRNITANGNLKENVVNLLKGEGDMSDYFKEYSRVGRDMPIDKSMTNIFFTSENVKEMTDYNSKKELFPMYCETSFSTDDLTQFSNMLDEANLSSEFINALQYSNRSSISSQFVAYSQNPNGVGGITNQQSKIFDVATWLNNFERNGAQRVSDDSVFIGRDTEDLKVAKSNVTSFSQKLYAMVYLGKLRNYITTRARTFKDVLAGDMAQAETVAYKISKYRGNPNGEPIQNFWFFNTGELDVIDFVDTQVKYNKEYTYQIFAYNFVLGTEYAYTNLAVSKTVADNCIELIDVLSGKPVEQKINNRVEENVITKGTTLIPVGKNPRYVAEFDVISRPCLKVLETLIYTKKIKVMDSAPIEPQMQVIPYVGVSDKIKIHFEGGMGSETAMPIVINESDKALFDQMRTNRDLDLDEPLPYRTDDFPVVYEVYRLTEKPTSYTDFSRGLRARIDLTRGQVLKNAAMISGAIVDDISSNQRYYYTVRCVDVHGNMSNPSSIHEIEVVEDKGATYLVHNVIDLEISKPYMVSKAMKRFLFVVPNISQSVINDEKSNLESYSSAKELENRLILGVQDEGIWNKKLKMRLTSKKTGRKIDINLKFKIRHIRSDVEK